MSASNIATVVDRTVLDRLVRAGIAESRALDHLRGGWVLVDDKVVTDPTFPAPVPTHVELKRIVRRSDSD